MPLFLETSDLICQAEDTCNKNHCIFRAGESLCGELSRWIWPVSLSLGLSSEAYTGETEEGREIAWITLGKYS